MTHPSAEFLDLQAALAGEYSLQRLHANAGDLAPLTTLMDAARSLGEDLNRLAEAQKEVDSATQRA